MKEDNPVLLQILEELPQDQDWDTSTIIGAVCQKQGLKRYKLDGVSSFNQKTTTDAIKESFISTATSSSAGSGSVFQFATGSSPDAVQVKLENSDFVEFQSKLQVLKSGKQQVDKLYSAGLDLRVVMEKKAQQDKIFMPKAEELTKGCDNMNKFLERLRQFIYQADLLDASHNCEKQLQECVSLIDQCQAHIDGMKSLQKRMRALF